jgi:Na+-transporting methylmalonyl-CoA/oxaloacetate decarboxylase gamma subunit
MLLDLPLGMGAVVLLILLLLVSAIRILRE